MGKNAVFIVKRELWKRVRCTFFMNLYIYVYHTSTRTHEHNSHICIRKYFYEQRVADTYTRNRTKKNIIFLILIYFFSLSFSWCASFWNFYCTWTDFRKIHHYVLFFYQFWTKNAWHLNSSSFAFVIRWICLTYINMFIAQIDFTDIRNCVWHDDEKLINKNK